MRMGHSRAQERADILKENNANLFFRKEVGINKRNVGIQTIKEEFPIQKIVTTMSMIGLNPEEQN